MTTKELIKKLEETGLEVEENEDGFYLDIFHLGVLTSFVGVKQIGLINTDFGNFKYLRKDYRKYVLSLLIEYSITPIEEREEQEKFYWKLKGFKGNEMNNDRVYFSYSPRHETQMIRMKGDRGSYTSAFTEIEFKKLCNELEMVYEAFEKELIKGYNEGVEHEIKNWL